MEEEDGKERKKESAKTTITMTNAMEDRDKKINKDSGKCKNDDDDNKNEIIKMTAKHWIY